MKLFLPIILIVILVGGYFGLQQFTKQKSEIPATQISSPTPKQDLKTFQSKIMKFSVDLPNNLSTLDEASRITIQNSNGKIYVNRNGTQFKNLETYLANFDQSINIETSVDEKLTINNYEARKRVFQNSEVRDGTEKIYFIYAENYVYKISTTSEALYGELDQIAQSFRYTP